MKRRVRELRNAAAQICNLRGFPFSKFLHDYGLEGILEEAEAEDWPAQKVAGQVLSHCCIEDGKFNNFQVGLLTVMTYLNEQCGSLGKGQEQAYRDLVTILTQTGTPQAIEKWLETHYP